MIRRLWRPSLFKRLLAWQLLVLLLALMASFAWGLWSAYAPRSGGIDRALTLRAESIARFSALNPAPVHARAVALQVQQLNQRESDIAVSDTDFAWQVWSMSPQLLASDGMPETFALMPPGSLEPGVRHDRGRWRLMAANSPDRKVWVVIGQAQAVSQRFNAKVVQQIIWIPLCYVLLLMIALWLATWRGLKPLAQLGKRIAERGAGSRDPIANPARDPLELQPIAAALDAYAVREAELRAAENRFFADAAHELRTPLAVIGAQAHVLSQERDVARHPALLKTLQLGVQRAGDVLSKVLTLSRLDAAGAGSRVTLKTVDFGKLLRERVEEHAMRAVDSGHDLGLCEGPAVAISINAALVSAAIDNLIDNALRYCPDGSHIDVSWGQQGGHAWWAVEDDGPGIPVAQRVRVFERFERGPGSHEVTGSGLGLSIAREVALKHGGLLRLEVPTSGCGCRFVMVLPCHPG